MRYFALNLSGGVRERSEGEGWWGGEGVVSLHQNCCGVSSPEVFWARCSTCHVAAIAWLDHTAKHSEAGWHQVASSCSANWDAKSEKHWATHPAVLLLQRATRSFASCGACVKGSCQLCTPADQTMSTFAGAKPFHLHVHSFRINAGSSASK